MNGKQNIRDELFGKEIMNSQRYTIKKSFLALLGTVTCLLGILLGLSLYYGPSPAELIVLGVISCALAGVLLECRNRSVTTGPEGIVIRKFMKSKEIPWDMIHQVGMMNVRRKRYLILTTGRGFHFFSASYGNFAELVRNVANNVSPELVDEAVREYMEDPEESRGHLASVSLAVILVLALIAMKILRII